MRTHCVAIYYDDEHISNTFPQDETNARLQLSEFLAETIDGSRLSFKLITLDDPEPDLEP